MSTENIKIDHRLEKYIHMDLPDFVFTEEGIKAMKGNPNARTPEQDKQYREETFKRRLSLIGKVK